MVDPLPFGVTLLAGRISDPAAGLQQVRDAERIGFNRAWLSERYDLKEAAVLCGAFAAVTDRIGVGTALVVDAVRHPLMTAAFGATMQATFGDRFALGISRGVRSHLEPLGLTFSSERGFETHARTLRALWAGETAGELRFLDPLTQPPPELVYGSFANQRGARLAARVFDRVLLVPFMAVDAVRAAVQRLRAACEEIDRDPRTLKVSHYIVTAPDFEQAEELAVVNARALTYLQIPGLGDRIIDANGWDHAPIKRLARQLGDGIADQRFHREQLLEIAASLPQEWMRSGAAIGTAETCCKTLASFFDAGVDDIVFHGSTPAQNDGLAQAWRARNR
ncbi:MAG: TIGR03857 family LLM class F420-dependent oxidoreductase [Solirubrobacteraceae bacterium]